MKKLNEVVGGIEQPSSKFPGVTPKSGSIVSRQLTQPVVQTPSLENFSNYLFIVGAQKAGTTALYKYLEQRRELVGGEIKEKAYFHRDNAFVKGSNYYRTLFPVGSKYSWGMDATPEYLYFGECASRIHAFAPNAKIVILLREPASRAFSAFNMYCDYVRQEWFRKRMSVANKHVREFFMPIVEGKMAQELTYYIDREFQVMGEGGELIEEPSLIRRGLYVPQLERYIRLFGRQNVLVLFSNELKTDTANTINRVLGFVGLEPLGFREYPMIHAREYIVDLSGKELISKRAGELFAKDKQELIHTYGLDVPW